MTSEVRAVLPAQISRLNPQRRVATVALRPVGQSQSYAGQYVGASGQLAPVTDLRTSYQIGRVVKVDPVAGGGAELSMVVGDDDTWHALAAGTARVDVLVSFPSSSGGDPIGGRPLRVEIC